MAKSFGWVFMLFFFHNAFTQIEFQKVCGSNKVENTQKILTLSDGFFSIGSTESFGAGKSDMLLVRFDNKGNILWSKTYGGMQDDFGTGIVMTQDNNFLLLGYGASFEEEYNDVFIIKITKEGEVIWSKVYGLERSEYSNMVITSSDGGFIILGETLNFRNNKKNSDVLLIKTDADGNLKWSHQYGGDKSDFAYSVTELKEGGYVIGGETNSYGSGDFDLYMLKVDVEGNALWSKTYGDTATEYGRHVLQAPDGGFIFGGSTQSFNAKDIDFCFIKTDNGGNVEWAKKYGGEGTDYLLSMCNATDDGFLSVGYSNSTQSKLEDVCLLYINYSAGKVFWTRLYGSEAHDVGMNVTYEKNNQVTIGGITHGFQSIEEDIYVIKTTMNSPSLVDCNHNYFYPFYSSKINIKSGQGHTQFDLKCKEKEVKVKTLNCEMKARTLCIQVN